MRRYATPTAIISVSSGRTKISINGLAKMKTNTDTRSEKNNSRDKCTANTPADTVVTCCPKVLCNESGKGVPKFLHGHIGERVNLHSCRKAAITAVPKLLTSPCTIRIPRFITDCWTQVSVEKEAISFKQVRSKHISS